MIILHVASQGKNGSKALKLASEPPEVGDCVYVFTSEFDRLGERLTIPEWFW